MTPKAQATKAKIDYTSLNQTLNLHSKKVAYAMGENICKLPCMIRD
jgi:hypothetical protein